MKMTLTSLLSVSEFSMNFCWLPLGRDDVCRVRTSISGAWLSVHPLRHGDRLELPPCDICTDACGLTLGRHIVQHLQMH